ncbi:MAG: cobalt-precorrin-7 (C(5))-methyltransferase [Methanomicrobiales archaeon]|nr:cobalt-precorrin-7 (C(5))-methyltransferase [Methanomicrobiales archaeon]
MKVVGVGCGPGMLTEEAIRVIRAATEIHGSRRAIELARAHIPEGCRVVEIRDYNALGDLPADAVVLSTGDPMLAGLGKTGTAVVPGISSLQVAAARLGIPLTRIVVVDAHARDRAEAVDRAAGEIRRGRVAFLLTDPEFDPAALAAALRGMPGRIRIAVCDRLGYPDEEITTGTPEHPPGPGSSLSCTVAGEWE